MASEREPNQQVEIAHVLSIDLVGYSLLLITDQTRVMSELASLVKNTEQFRRADAQGRLVRIPTGDGMSLVFFDDPQAPIECATEIAAALKSHPDIRLRMGIHSGPVNEVIDVSDRSNLAGAGMDMAQRVMDCGDAGHILLSKHVADDLAPFPRWNPHLHPLGECEVKHGRKIGLVNFYTDKIGNSQVPTKCAAQHTEAIREIHSCRIHLSGSKRPLIAGVALFVIVLAIAAFVFFNPKALQSWRKADAAQAGNHSIAVLPFENASGDPNAEYLSEGISEALINSLTELQQLRVIARSTAFHYKGKDVDPQRVGRELHVAAVLTGRVRQMQDALSVQVDLVDAITGAQLWGAAYDRKISDVIAVKQAIAREVTRKLKLRLTGEEERRLVKRDTTNAEAYQFYLRGRYFWNKRTPDGIKQAIEQFQQAIERDPNFALGYAGLADSYLLLQQYVGVPSSEALPKAERPPTGLFRSMIRWPKRIPLRLWSTSSTGNGLKPSRNSGAPSASIPIIRRRITGFALYFHTRTGSSTTPMREIKRAQELDPLSPIINANIAIIFLLQERRPRRPLSSVKRLSQLDPNHISGHDWLSWAYVKAGALPGGDSGA